MKFASRLDNVTESATFKYSAMAKKEGIINLTIGRTGFDTPEAIKEAAKKALDEGKVHYTPTKGIIELREAIVNKLENKNSIGGLDPDKVIVSSGAKQILFELAMALVGKGDVVALPDPSWVSYEPIVKLAGGTVKWLPLKPENGFIPDDEFFSALENANPSPKLIFLNSPNNPTGAVYPKEIIKKIIDIAEDKGSWIVSDEIYERIIYDGARFSPASVYPNTITVNGFSKEFSMTGWRLGYVACSNQEIIDKINLVQGQSASCATSFAQYGAVSAFTGEVDSEVDYMVAELEKRRDYVTKRLASISDSPKLKSKSDSTCTNLVCTNPGGAFYAFPFFEGVNDIEYTNRLLELGVGVIPGSFFGSAGRGCIRISYGDAGLPELEKAFDIIENSLE